MTKRINDKGEVVDLTPEEEAAYQERQARSLARRSARIARRAAQQEMSTQTAQALAELIETEGIEARKALLRTRLNAGGPEQFQENVIDLLVHLLPPPPPIVGDQ